MPVNLLEASAPAGERTLIDLLIDEQRSLSAVERFSQQHENHLVPSQERYYRSLLPARPPETGEQFAFEVNLDQCSGCKACVTACHSLNGLDDQETWRDLGLLHGGNRKLSLQRHVTTACHHCVDPACLNGCPVLAYDKDPVTGIVRHLDDQCIGCQYCVLKCPYEVPKYSESRGIVRKCDMCSNRLAAGEAPACVQACPNEAIRITIVEQASFVQTYREREHETNPFLPSSPEPAYTLPTTRYTSAAPLPPTLQAGDSHLLRPQPAHWPLVFMLVLTQMSAGAFVFDFVSGVFSAPSVTAALRPLQTALALATGLIGIGASVLHLGRPLGAWRAFLGLRKSWLSREIVVFGAFAGLAILYVISVWAAQLPLPGAIANWLPKAGLWPLFASVVAATGLAGVFSSVMIYHDTRREFWAFSRSGARFFGSALWLGLSLGLFALSLALLNKPALATSFTPPLLATAVALTAVAVTKLLIEFSVFRVLRKKEMSSLQRTARLQSRLLRPVTLCRFGLGIFAGVALPVLIYSDVALSGEHFQPFVMVLMTAAALLLSLAGEILERSLFFTSVAPVKMPGGIAP